MGLAKLVCATCASTHRHGYDTDQEFESLSMMQLQTTLVRQAEVAMEVNVADPKAPGGTAIRYMGIARSLPDEETSPRAGRQTKTVRVPQL